MTEREFSPDEQNERRENPLGELAQQEATLSSETKDALAQADTREGGRAKSRWKKGLAVFSMLGLFNATTEMALAHSVAAAAITGEASAPAGIKPPEAGAAPEREKRARELSPETKKALAEILSHTPENQPPMFIETIRPDDELLDPQARGEHDYSRQDLTARTSPLRFDHDPEQLESAGFLLVYPRAEWEARNAAATPDTQSSGGKPVVNRVIDEHGNLVSRCYQVRGDQIQEIISLNPKFLGAKPGRTEAQLLDFDLNPFGLPEVKGLLEVKPWPLNRKLGAYDLYTQQPNREFSDKQEQFLAAIGKGQEEGETFFGIKPGEQIKNMFLFHSKEKWGQAEDASHIYDDTTLYSDTFMDSGLPKVGLAGAHEAFHVIGRKLGLVGPEINNEITKFYHGEMSSKFLPGLRESSFEPGLSETDYGHADDNPDEFFASLMNSLRSDNWTEQLNDPRTNPKARGWYLGALRALQKDIAGCREIGADTPLVRTLKEKISILEKPQPKPVAAAAR